MLTFRTFGAASVLAAALIVPALAQTPARSTTDTAPGIIGTKPAQSMANTATKGPTGNMDKVHGMWRSTDLVGATVYNDTGHSIGTIENLLITRQGKVSQAIISVGGFLGIGNKLVEEPFTHLKFKLSENKRPAVNGTLQEPATTKTSTDAMRKRQDYSVVLPGSTKKSLQNMKAFTDEAK